MQFLSTLPFLMRHASLRVRVYSFLSGCVADFALITLLLFLASDIWGVALCTIPVIIAAWFFKPAISFLCTLGILALSATLMTVEMHTIRWPLSTLEGFLFGSLAIFCIFCGFCCLALAVDALTKQAEKNLTILPAHAVLSDEQRDQELMHVSHELRTPLTEVKGYINLLLEYGDKIDNSTRSSFLKSASHGCEELELIVGNVLDSSRVGKDLKPLHMQKLVLYNAVSEICEHIYSEEHVLQLEVPSDLVVVADRQQLRQILRNLLSNAMKYSSVHSTIVVRARLFNSMVCLSVQDAGPGILAEDVPQLFQKFSRLKRDASGPIRGTGLGLYISKQMVEGMGGKIWVESEGLVGKGSRFCFTLRRVMD